MTQVFGERWIGRNGPTEMPPRSPDLTAMDFFLWGFIKERVYAVPIRDEDYLRNRIVEVFEELKNHPETLNSLHLNMVRRCNLCIQHDGQHIEQHMNQ